MSLFKKIIKQFNYKPVDWEKLEEILVKSDIGIRMTLKIIQQLQEMGRKISAEDVNKVCKAEILKIFNKNQQKTSDFKPLSDKELKVILISGVNGTGKTTSCAKLANFLQKMSGKKVVMAAADTFRAAAVEQLEIWGKRLDIHIIKGNLNADPSSVCFTAYDFAKKQEAGYLICDTAGRLHTKHNLMNELKKINYVLKKKTKMLRMKIYLLLMQQPDLMV